MFLRVSSLQCASDVEGNLALRLPLPRPSTRCGVVNQQKSTFVEVYEQQVGGGWGGWSGSDATSTTSRTSRTSLTSFSSHLTIRVRLVSVGGEEQDARASSGEPACEHAGDPGLPPGSANPGRHPRAAGGSSGARRPRIAVTAPSPRLARREAALAWARGQPTASSKARSRGACPARRKKCGRASARSSNVRVWREVAGTVIVTL